MRCRAWRAGRKTRVELASDRVWPPNPSPESILSQPSYSDTYTCAKSSTHFKEAQWCNNRNCNSQCGENKNNSRARQNSYVLNEVQRWSQGLGCVTNTRVSPLMHWIANRRRKKVSQHCIQEGYSGTVRLIPFCSQAGGQSLIENCGVIGYAPCC